MEKKEMIIILTILVLAFLAVYFTLYHTRECEDINCFNKALAKCQRATYIKDAEEAVWLYKILGKEGDNCEINVKLLRLKEGVIEVTTLEGKEMICSLPLGTVSDPQKSLDNCHGVLKEEMQKLVINKLYSYIYKNIGEISKQLTKPL